MGLLKTIFCSSIGRKVVMAVTGLGLVLFLIGHLLGNLQIFLGQDVFNGYAEFLHSKPALLWPARIGLILMFALHLVTAAQLQIQNTQARPISYRKNTTLQASPASLTMIHTGVVVLLFLILHLLHFTFGNLQPEYSALIDAKGRNDVYSMLILGFQNILYADIYIVCLLLLGFHLSHAIASTFQTIGINHPKFTPWIERGSAVVGAIIALGYISIPMAVLLEILNVP